MSVSAGNPWIHHELLEGVSSYLGQKTFSDLEIVCGDGVVYSHKLTFCRMSPLLKSLTEGHDDPTVLFLPDFSKEEVYYLLHLLYTGNVDLCRSEIRVLITLTKVLKLMSIPVVLISKSSSNGASFDECAASKDVSDRVESEDNKSADKVLMDCSEERSEMEKIDVHMLADDKDGCDPRNLENNKVSNLSQSESAEKTQDRGSRSNALRLAEALERSQRPDFNDVTSAVTSETEKLLVRNCVLCDKRILGRNAYGRHMKNAHPKVFGPYPCPLCGKRLESGSKILQHVRVHIDRWKCSECEASYAVSARLNEHLRLKHGKSRNERIAASPAELKFSCEIQGCSQAFATAKGFTEHMSLSHEVDKPWCCEPCRKSFKEKQNYDYHLMTHGGSKNFGCDICEKTFANPRQLYCHRALHLGKRFLCPQCGYRARSSANLRGHIKSKHELRRYECQHCFKKFGSGNNLKNHVRIHTGETPYVCELCGVRFKRLHHLNSHIESKGHGDVMSKCAEEGREIPERLDPLKRIRGRVKVKDGPVTLVASSVN